MNECLPGCITVYTLCTMLLDWFTFQAIKSIVAYCKTKKGSFLFKKQKQKRNTIHNKIIISASIDTLKAFRSGPEAYEQQMSPLYHRNKRMNKGM